jgi:hypothetical protein
MPIATVSRLMQFSTGPQQHRFYACPECLEWLRHGPQLFYAIKYKGLEPVDPEEEIECDGCREGG